VLLPTKVSVIINGARYRAYFSYQNQILFLPQIERTRHAQSLGQKRWDGEIHATTLPLSHLVNKAHMWTRLFGKDNLWAACKCGGGGIILSCKFHFIITSLVLSDVINLRLSSFHSVFIWLVSPCVLLVFLSHLSFNHPDAIRPLWKVQIAMLLLS
jgi:hypothetical protein